MNKRQIIASLNKIANELDLNNLYKEANTLTKVMTRLAEDDDFELGLGAVPHRRIDSPMNSSDYYDKDGDIDLSDYENKDGDWRDSLLTNEQKSVVQKSRDMESIFNKFEPYARKILNKVGSQFILRGAALEYFSANETERAQMMSHYENKSIEDFPYGEDLNKYIFEFLKMAQGFQDEHGVPDFEMKTFIEALRQQH